MHIPYRFLADVNLSHTESGLMGEYIAAASVMARGWRVAMAQQDSVDLIAWHPETSVVLRIQVKACQASKGGDSRYKKDRLRFQMGLGATKRLPTRRDFDILACVSSEQRTVWYIPVTDVDMKKITKSTGFYANPELETESWQRCLDILRIKDGS